ncbi:MAG: 23S rRNA (adenine(2503)-C(2))-methyltransferase RlmN [Bacteroidetes bacterium]|nr:MAG: 23S rRNA (adenine(2503)-C(2))-methyltransferase RlmN [Bacteroidota bacterium]
MNGNPKPDIRSLSRKELDEFLCSIGEKPFRTKQISDWLWKKGCRSYEGMTNLSLSLRNQLDGSFSFHIMRELHRQVSRDGTVKLGYLLYDGVVIESVLIPADERTTACISSQAGCALGCTFCATGLLGFNRNLTAAELVDQVWNLNEVSHQLHRIPLSNIVLMGMGEPLLNYPQVMRAIDLITATEGMGISPQRITLSTVGIPKMIRQLADDQVKAHLALSLHAATDAARDRIIPYNKQYPVPELVSALRYYHKKTGKRFTIEYLLLKGINDSPGDARSLLEFCRNFPVKINLIEYNPVEGVDFQRSGIKKMKEFRDILESHNLVVNIRQSRGKDINAACGQLAGRTRDEEREM